MKSWVKWVGGVAVAAAMLGASVPASADDHGHWGGLYIGASAGWMGSYFGWTYHDPSGAVVDRPIGKQSTDSGVFGGFIGLQHQVGQLVIGVEASLNGMGNGNNFGSTSCTNPAFNCQARNDGYLLTLGPRLGWAPSEKWMIYGTGGVASGKVATQEVNAATGVVNGFSTSTNQTGYFVGGGLEYAITHSVIFGVEYKHYDLGEKLHAPLVFSTLEFRNINATYDAVTARLSFKLGRKEEREESLK